MNHREVTSRLRYSDKNIIHWNFIGKRELCTGRTQATSQRTLTLISPRIQNAIDIKSLSK